MSAKRALAVIIMAFTVIGLVVLIAGAVGIWSLKSSLIDFTQAIFDPADRMLTLADGRLEQVDQRAEHAQTRLATIETNLAQLGSNVEQNSLILTAISQTVGADLAPTLTQIREGASAARELVEAANDTMQKFNVLPFVSVEAPGSEAIQNLVDSITAAETAAEELKTNLKTARADRIQAGVDKLSRPLQTIQDKLAGAQAAVSEIRGGIVQSQARLQATHDLIVDWLNMLPWLLTILLAWLGLGQFILFKYAYTLFRSQPAQTG